MSHTKGGKIDMEEWIKKSDVVKALNAEAREQFRLDDSYSYVIGTLRNVEDAVNSIPFVQVPPKPKDDVVGYRWVLKWDLKELWTGLR